MTALPSDNSIDGVKYLAHRGCGVRRHDGIRGRHPGAADLPARAGRRIDVCHRTFSWTILGCRAAWPAPGGKTADRKGRRTALLLGMVFCAVAGVLYLPIFGLWAMAVGRALHGLGEGFFVTAAVAWAVDIAPDNRRAQTLGFLSSGIWGGVSIGPAIGQALGSMSSVSLFLTFTSIAVMAIVFVMHEQPRPHGHSASRWFPPPVLLPGIMLGLGNVTYAAMAGFLILLLRHRGHGTTWAFSAFAVAVLLGRAVFGGLPDRMGPRPSLLTGYVCIALGLIAIIAGPGWQFDVPAALLVGLGYALPWPALASVVVGQVSVSERAAALGALNAFYDLFVAVGSAVAGAAAGHWGFTSPFWMSLGCVGVAAILVLTIGAGPKSRSLPEFSSNEPEVPVDKGAFVDYDLPT